LGHGGVVLFLRRRRFSSKWWKLRPIGQARDWKFGTLFPLPGSLLFSGCALKMLAGVPSIVDVHVYVSLQEFCWVLLVI
jgi:hypothetical protein